MIGLQKDFESHMRKMDAKLELLKRVIESIQKGEEVDVEKMLGTGDLQKEREWEESNKLLVHSTFGEMAADLNLVLKEIEAEDSLWHARGNTVQRRKSKSKDSTNVDPSPEEAEASNEAKYSQLTGSTAKFY